MIDRRSAVAWGGSVLVAAALPAARAQRRYRIVIMPKLVGIAYYEAVKTGIDAAARELPDTAAIAKVVLASRSCAPTKPRCG
jgi:rhamnose transport system substrate-binding protein